MTDNGLIALIISLLGPQLTVYSISAEIAQKYQPTMQGAPSSDSIFLQKITDKRIGHPKRKSDYDTLLGKQIDTDIQLMEADFQLSAWVRQTTSSTLTASDILATVALIIQSESFIESLKANDVGILRITELRNPYFKDDKDQYQASPSFDFSLSYNRELTRDGRFVSQFDYNIGRV